MIIFIILIWNCYYMVSRYKVQNGFLLGTYRKYQKRYDSFHYTVSELLIHGLSQSEAIWLKIILYAKTKKLIKFIFHT